MDLKVSTAELRQGANNLNSSSVEMASLLNEIKGLMDKIGEEDIWAGESAQASREEFDKLSAKFPSFSEAVKNCSDGLITFANNYDEQEAKIKSAIVGGS